MTSTSCDRPHCYLDAEGVAAALGMPAHDIVLAQRRGDLSPPDAFTCHGQALWAVRSLSRGVIAPAKAPPAPYP